MNDSLYLAVVRSSLCLAVHASLNSPIFLPASAFWTFLLSVLILVSVYSLVLYPFLVFRSPSRLEWHLLCPFICKLSRVFPLYRPFTLGPCFFHISCCLPLSVPWHSPYYFSFVLFIFVWTQCNSVRWLGYRLSDWGSTADFTPWGKYYVTGSEAFSATQAMGARKDLRQPSCTSIAPIQVFIA